MVDSRQLLNATGQTLLVFGAAGGIGSAVDWMFRRAGGHVMAADIEPMPEKTSRISCVCDASKEEDVYGAVAQTIDRFGKLDAVVHCVGVPGRGPITDTTLKAWSHVMSINLTSAYLAARAAFPHLRESKGVLVFVASTSGLDGGSSTTGPAYAASKGGMISLARYLAKEWGDHGVRVNTIAPGPVRTPLMAQLPAERQAQYASSMLTKRLIECEEIAAGIGFLLSGHAKSMTGAVLNASGGLVLD